MAHFIWCDFGFLELEKLVVKKCEFFFSKLATIKIIILFLHRFLEDVPDRIIEKLKIADVAQLARAADL